MDEAASVISATRPWSSLWTLVGDIDAVHGVYYGLHVWTSVFGISELATRFPSAVAVGAMVGGTVVLCRMFVGPVTSTVAAVVCMVMPRATDMAIEARSYAFTAAAAVWLTVLLVHLIRTQASRSRWLLYSCAAAAAMYIFLYFGLVLLVHGLFVLVAYRKRIAAWVQAAAYAVIGALPIVLIGFEQREQIAFLGRRDYATAYNVLVTQWFLSPLAAGVCGVLILVSLTATVAMARARDPILRQRLSLSVLGAIWLIAPTATLLVAHAVIGPTYNMRYLSLSTPAVAVLVALGITAIRARVRHSWRKVMTVGLTAVVVASCIPVYLYQRAPFAKDDGSDLRQVASYVRGVAEAGDAVVFDQTTKLHEDPRLSIDLYPDDFTGLRDVALSVPAAHTDSLWDAVKPNDSLAGALRRSPTVWAVEFEHAGVPADVEFLQSLGYTVVSEHLVHRTTVYRLVR